MLACLGTKATSMEVNDLLDSIDKRFTGLMYHDAYLEHIIPFLRSKYKSVRANSLLWMQKFFEDLDLNGDQVLSESEFHHIVTSLRRAGVATPLDEEEATALMEFLDADKSKSIDWYEFKMAYQLLNDPEAMDEMPPLARMAFRKVSIES